MKLVLLILAATAVIFVLAATATCIYRAKYERLIAQRLALGISTPSKKPMLSPFRFFWICTLLLCLLTLLFLSVTSISVAGQEDRISVCPCDPEGITKMFDAQHEIPGYTRLTAEDDPFRFVYYFQEQADEACFPQIMIYVESGDGKAFFYQCQLQDDQRSPPAPRQGAPGWYAVNCGSLSGAFLFSCANDSGSGSVTITIPQ